jgi:hypothetical protein
MDQLLPWTRRSRKEILLDKAANLHENVPGINKLPLPVLGIIGLLVVVNILVWGGAGTVLVCSQFSDFRVLFADLVIGLSSVSLVLALRDVTLTI